jgi:hypothetical protein
MAGTVDPTGQAGRSEEQSTGQQAKEKMKETTQQVQEKAQEARGQVGDRARQQVDTRSTQAGEQVGSIADAMRRTGAQLRSEGKETPAKVSEQAAERAERLGGYLRDSDADRILGDIEAFARRQPWAVAAGGLVLGFIASRFLKASSSRRYESVSREQNRGLYAGYDPGYPPLPAGTPTTAPGATTDPLRSAPVPGGTTTTP